MKTKPASPLTVAIRATRDNALPLAIIMLGAAGMVFAYYHVPDVAGALNQVGNLNKAYPIPFSVIITAFFAGFIPWCFRMAFPKLRPAHPLGDLIHSLIWWGIMGMITSYFYYLQASWFGDEATLKTVLIKVVVDMAVFTVFIGSPLNAISHLWKDCGWDTAKMKLALRAGWYRRLVFPNLVTNYIVWIPGTLIFYSMPTDLQIVVANCIGCFWALMCARIAAHSGIPLTDIHA